MPFCILSDAKRRKELRPPDIVNDPFAHFLRAILRSPFYLYLGSADIGVKRSVDSFPYQRSLFLQVEMLEQHSDRKNLGKRIGDIQPFRLRPRTVDRLKNRCAFTCRRRRQKSHRTADAGTFVCQDITECIFSLSTYI